MTTKVLTGHYIYGYQLEAPVTILSIATTGTIDAFNGGRPGIFTLSTASAAYEVINSGLIVSDQGGVYLAHGGTVINQSTGEISGGGASQGVEITGGPGSVVNFGTISSSVLLGVGGTVTNGSRTNLSATLESVSVGGAGTVSNFGTIDGTVSAVTVSSYGTISGGVSLDGRLTNGSLRDKTALISAALISSGEPGVFGEGTVSNFGTIESEASKGAGVSLEDAASVVTNGGAGDSSALITGYDGVVCTVTCAITNFGTIEATGASGIAVEFTGAKSTLALELNSKIDGSVRVGGGAIDVVGGTAGVDGGVVTKGAITGAGTLSLSGGVSTLDAGAKLTVAEIAVSGAATAADISTNLIYAKAWDQTAGTLSVAAGDEFKLTDAGDAFSGTLAGSGIIDLTGTGDTLKDVTLSAAKTEIDAASATLVGAFDVTGLLVLASPDITVATGAIARWTGGGSVEMSDAATNEIVGATASAILQNSDKIEGAGNLGGGQLRLTNEAGGVIDGNASQVLVIDTAAEAFVNGGLVEAVGAGGVTVEGAVNNSGTLEAAGGTLTVDGVVTGAGGLRISGSTAGFAAAFSQNVAFTTAGGELELADSQAYAGTISGFSKTGATSLDLEDINFATATETYSGTTKSGVLTVTDGTHTASIKLTGNYRASVWTLTSDGHGGTVVTDPTSPAHGLAAAMASFAPAASGGESSATSPAALAHPLLASPRLG